MGLRAYSNSGPTLGMAGSSFAGHDEASADNQARAGSMVRVRIHTSRLLV
jgi:hypothetical protein